MFHRLENEKLRKSLTVLQKEDKWNDIAFKASDMYSSYQSAGDCPICGKGPATHEEKEIDEGVEPVKSCFYCYRDKFILGKKLPVCNYIAFGKGDVSKE